MNNEKPTHWQDLNNDSQAPRYKAIRDVINHRFLSPQLFPPAILDVGCGAGVLADYLDGRGIYSGIEPGFAAYQQARSKGLNVRHGTAEDIILGSRYDAIVFSECLYYTFDPAALLDRYMRALTPRGIVIVTIFMRHEAPRWRHRWMRVMSPRTPTTNVHCAELVDRFFARHPNFEIKHIPYPGTNSVWRMWVAGRNAEQL